MSTTDGFDHSRMNTMGAEPYSPGMGHTFTSGFSNACINDKIYNNNKL
jgi:hypothetical protein